MTGMSTFGTDACELDANALTGVDKLDDCVTDITALDADELDTDIMKADTTDDDALDVIK